jgi:hypothetical protein
MATIRLLPNQNISQDVRLTVLLKESNIIDPQADRAATSGVVTDYNHKNVLRRMLSDFRGDFIASQATAFEAIEKTYTFSIPSESGWWKTEDLFLVAFVSAGDGEIWQGDEKPLIP